MKTAETAKALEALFDAVDDYLYSEVTGKGYPEGHSNSRFLERLRRAFLNCVDTLRIDVEDNDGNS